jgi:hypothetical protein
MAGADGKDGTDGTDGIDGEDGVSVTSAPEPAGANCANGGSRFTAANSVVTYACNGAQGPPGPAGGGLVAWAIVDVQTGLVAGSGVNGVIVRDTGFGNGLACFDLNVAATQLLGTGTFTPGGDDASVVSYGMPGNPVGCPDVNHRDAQVSLRAAASPIAGRFTVHFFNLN